MASEVAGFCTLRVKFDQNCSSYHVLYYKKHVVREEETTRPSDRTLFVVNVPPYCDKFALKRLFGTCGAVQSVYLMKQPGKVKKAKKSSLVNPNKEIIKGFKVSYVVFKSSKSLDAAMELDSTEVRVLSDDNNPIQTGMEKWCHEYSLRYPNSTRLQEEVDKFMGKFDQEQEKAKIAEEKARGQPDEEGWVTVGKGGRKPGASQMDATELKEKKKKKKQAMVNFYQFQQRETRREHIAQLRKKFEEDKKKIADMKSARKFRPY